MSEFARHVVREEVAHASLVPRALVQKRREKLVRAILGGDVYCHFERRGPNLACAFSNERKVLLAELVRDWLAGEHGARSFLWCEGLDGALALVLVADGRVVKDDLDVANTDRDVRAALAQLGPERAVFVHADVATAGSALEDVAERQVLDTSVRDHLRDLRSRGRPIPELALVDSLQAVQRWNIGALWARRAAVAAVLVVAGALALDWWRNRPDSDAEQVAVQGPTVSEAEYLTLLQAPDPAVLLPAIHRAYRRLLADPVLGAHWTVSNLAWNRQGDQLAVSLALPKTPGATEPLGADLQAEVVAYAATRGWAVAWEGEDQGTTVRVPVAAPATPERTRVPERAAADDPWHLTRLAEDLAPFGELRAFNTERNSTFHSTLWELVLKSADWSSPELANWLGTRLGGGPMLHESLVLVQRGPWVTGGLRFRSVYCAPADPAAASCPDGPDAPDRSAS